MRLWIAALIVGSLVACESPAPPLPSADHVYDTRGVVERMQVRDDDTVMILHEEIADFVGFDGKPAPMHSMSMPFAIADGVSAAGVKVGSKLAFTFEVRWTGGDPLLITALETLPDDTQLDVDD